MVRQVTVSWGYGRATLNVRSSIWAKIQSGYTSRPLKQNERLHWGWKKIYDVHGSEEACGLKRNALQFPFPFMKRSLHFAHPFIGQRTDVPCVLCLFVLYMRYPQRTITKECQEFKFDFSLFLAHKTLSSITILTVLNLLLVYPIQQYYYALLAPLHSYKTFCLTGILQVNNGEKAVRYISQNRFKAQLPYDSEDMNDTIQITMVVIFWALLRYLYYIYE